MFGDFELESRKLMYNIIEDKTIDEVINESSLLNDDEFVDKNLILSEKEENYLPF